MKILFVSSGNLGEINPSIKAQANSLIKKGVVVEFELIVGKGFWGYLQNVPRLIKRIKEENFDLVHAHFSLSAYAATLSRPKKIVVSLMGSDIIEYTWNKLIIRFFASLFWDATIVKSQEMFQNLKLQKAKILPNGVSFDIFKPCDKVLAQEKLNWDPNKTHILFAGNPERRVKNVKLALDAIKIIRREDFEIHYLVNIPHLETLNYFNASDVVILTSLWEGSPNVIKEAMACNRPIVSTDCGDVKELFEGVDGCLISSYDPAEFAKNILIALNFSETKGREKIDFLGENRIADQLIGIYSNLKKSI